MTGRRRDGIDPVMFEPGDYGYFEGTLYALTPNGLLANLSRHTVTEVGHDGRLSVEPSILVNGGRPVPWHGYLRGGEWQEC